MNNTETLAILLIASAVMILAGLVIIPAIQEAQAANSISDARSKGKWGAIQGNGGGVCGQCG